MKKIKFVWLILGLVMLTACGSQGEKLDAKVEEEYINMSKEIITSINESGLKFIEDKYSDEMKTAMTDESIKQVEDMIAEKGKFVEFGKGAAANYTDEKTNKTYIVSQLEAKYENGKFIYTINYDQDGKVSGFFLK